ncbi:hypothetical protein E4T56_gene6174 [Termitomyces sp. T112]|nr:hypothetical protein E4T56_gene6174 [Termitomyces sp. T112]
MSRCLRLPGMAFVGDACMCVPLCPPGGPTPTLRMGMIRRTRAGKSCSPSFGLRVRALNFVDIVLDVALNILSGLEGMNVIHSAMSGTLHIDTRVMHTHSEQPFTTPEFENKFEICTTKAAITI